MKNTEKAIEYCKIGLNCPFVRTGNLFDLSKRLAKLIKEKSVGFELSFRHISYKMDQKIESKSGPLLFKAADGSSCSVEQFALHAYLKEWPCGLYCENSLFSTLFGLAFYDILFDDSVPFAFRTAYQSHPLDLFHDSFYSSRKSAIEDRLAEIVHSLDFFITRLSDIYANHNKEWIVGVSWDIPLDSLVEICHCLKGERLAKIFKFYAEDYRNARSGLPDLVVWNPVFSLICFVEVKSDNDRLSSKQKFWLEFLKMNDLDAEVCKVTKEQ